MTRVFKFLAAAVGLFVLLLIAIGLYFRFVFDPNDFRDTLGSAVESQTGRSFAIEGDIDLHYFPWVGVTLGRTTLGEDAAFGGGDFVSFESASVRMKVLPLLSKRLEVGKLQLDGLNVTLVRNEQGVDNWSTLAGGAEAEPTAAEPATGSASSFTADKVGGLELTNAAIVFDDRQAGTVMRVTDLSALTGPIGRGAEEIALSAGFDLDVSEPDVSVRVDFDGDGRNDDGTLRFANPVLRVSGAQQTLSEGLTVDTFALNITAAALAANETSVNMPAPSVSLRAQGGSVDELDLSLGASSLSMDIEGDSLTLPSPELTLAVSGELVPAPVDLRLTADALSVAPTAETLSLGNYVLNAMGVNARGSLQASNWSDTLRASGPLVVEAFSARDLMAQLDIPVETADASALSSVAVNAALDLRGDVVGLKDLSLKLDDTTVTGRAGLSSIERSALDFDLVVDAINLDRYLAPAAAPAEGAPGSAADAIVLPAESVRGVNAKGALKVGAMTFSGIESTDVEIGLNAGDGKVRVNPSRARLYGGTYSGDIRLDATGERPRLSINETVNGIDFNAFAATVMPGAPMHGTLTGNVLMTATGETTADLQSTLNGTADFDFANGYVDGIDLWNVVQGIVAAADKAVPTVNPRPWRTDFERLEGRARVVNGVVEVETLAASVPHLDVTGGGRINLNDSALNLSVQAKIVEEEGLELLPRERSLVGFRVPVVIGGTIEAPKPDTGASVTAVLGQLAKRKLADRLGLTNDEDGDGTSQGDVDAALDQKKEELKDRLDNKVKDALGGLFGRGKDDSED